MLLSLIAGIILGGLTVVFALQNVGMVTVTFFAWQASAPLSVVLLMTALSGMSIALLAIMPNAIKDAVYLSAVKREKREVEEELAQHRFAKSRLPRYEESQSGQYTPHSQRDAFAG